MFRIPTILAVIGLLVVIPLSATATAQTTYPLNEQDPVAHNFSTNSTVSNWVRGYRFEVNVPHLTVVELGCLSPTSNSDPQTLSLWEVSSQQELVRLTTTPGTGWVWEPLPSPITLTMGEQYIVTQHGAGTVPYYFASSPGSSWFPSGDITYIQMDYRNNTTQPAYPNQSLSNHQYGVVDFGYTLGTHTVSRGGVTITDGDTDEPTGVNTVTPTMLTYTVENSTSSDIPVTNVTLDNPTNVTATVTTVPATIPANGTETFTIDATVSGVGPWSVEVELETTNSTPTSYTFTIEGDAQPEIDAEVDGALVGSAPVGLASVPARMMQEVTFEVLNNGTAPLAFTSPPTVSATAGDFESTPEITEGESITSIEPGESEPVAVSYAADTGAYTFEVSFESNDPTQATYVVVFEGNALARPELVVLVESEQADSPLEWTEPPLPSDVEREIVLLVRNDGDAELEFDDEAPFLVTVEENEFPEGEPAVELSGGLTPIAPEEVRQATIIYTPVRSLQYAFTVELVHNDPSQPPFEIHVSGDARSLSAGSRSCAFASNGQREPFALLGLVVMLLLLAIARRCRLA